MKSKTPKLTAEQVKLKYGTVSGLEGYVMQDLEKYKNLSVAFESEKLSYEVDVKKYTPDFVLTAKSGNKMYIETKGRFMPVDRSKHLYIKQQHPDLDLRFVFTNSKAKLSSSSKTTYAAWCEKYGFLYADKLVPQAWIDELLNK